MNTTSLFADLLISGLQGLFWLSLLFLSIFGYKWIDLETIKDLQAPLLVIVIAVVYPIGVIVDELADQALKSWNRRIRSRCVPDESISVMQLLVEVRDDRLSSYFDYVRTRIRVCRSTALNFVLIASTAMLFTTFQQRALPARTFVTTLLCEAVVGFGSAIAALFAWQSITENFYRMLARRKSFSR